MIPGAIRSAVLGTAVLLKTCTPGAQVPDDDDSAPTVAVQVEPAPPPEPPGPPTIPADALLPFPADDPRATASAALREALAAQMAGDHDGALRRLDAAEAASAPYAAGLRQWVRGQTLRALGRSADADVAFAAVPAASRWWPEAALVRAELALATPDADAVLSLLGASGPPTPAGHEPRTDTSLALRADVLRARALKVRDGEGDALAAWSACKRIWCTDGRNTEAFAEAEASMAVLRARVPAAEHVSLDDRVLRATSLGKAHRKDDVISLLGGHEDAIQAADAPVACDGMVELGRAWHKKRKYTESVKRLSWAVEHCPEGDRRVVGRYLHAQALGRLGRSDEAVDAWIALANAAPEHRFADDALFHAGEERLDAGRHDEARHLFREMATRHPDGDMIGRGLWGMAWAGIASGDHDAAMPWLQTMVEGDPRGPARKRILQGRYWNARLRLDGADAPAARAELGDLAADHPLSWYGLLAHWRLHREDPAAAAAAAARAEASLAALRAGPLRPAAYVLDEELAARAGFSEALDLLRGGMPGDAADELRRVLGPKPFEAWGEGSLLLASEVLSQAGDHHASHNLFRMRFRQRFPELAADSRPSLLLGYPEAYWDLVQEVTPDVVWDRRTFQGLVREESAFSPGVKSWAGAAGLSQLMWPTAKEVARKMGIRITRKDLGDPKTNLSIGSTYFNGLMTRWAGHTPLAIGSYNAGPGAMNKWLRQRGDHDLDAFVETVPYDETRNYIKRVVGTWQTYHALYGEGGPFVPLRTGPADAARKQPDPTPAAP